MLIQRISKGLNPSESSRVPLRAVPWVSRPIGCCRPWETQIRLRPLWGAGHRQRVVVVRLLVPAVHRDVRAFRCAAHMPDGDHHGWQAMQAGSGTRPGGFRVWISHDTLAPSHHNSMSENMANFWRPFSFTCYACEICFRPFSSS